MKGPYEELAFLKRYALTCTYLRGRLDVPKISLPSDRVATERSDDIRSGMTTLLPPAAAFSAADAPRALSHRDPLVIISTLLRYSLGQIRWEPRNPARLHAAIPRPGGGPFCTRLRLLVPAGNGRAIAWGYEPQGHALFVIADEPAVTDRVQLVIHSDPGRIVSGYGDLSLTLALLEAGHCYMQLLMLIAALDVPAAWTHEPASRPQYETTGQISIGCFSLDLGDLASELSARPASKGLVGWPNPPSDYAQRYPMLKRAASALDHVEESEPVDLTHATGWTLPRLLAASQRRSSGLQGDGFVPRRTLNAGALQQLLSDWTALASQAPWARAYPLRMFLAITCVDGMAPQIIEYDLAAGRVCPLRELDAATILRPHIGLGAGYNFDEFSFALLVTCPVLARLESEGAGAYRSALMEAGAAAQALSIALAERGMFGRPFRAISEAALEAKFGLEDAIVYAVLCGRDRIINPGYVM